ncbi:D-amino-acid oxidase, partial [Rubripirellula sp.]|nr:D-amino-acid oxidase [Rubripirellula sp.]
LRPMTYDGFPMIGRVPGTNNAYVAGGHFRSGLHLSTGTASVLCDLMVKREPVIDLDAFRVGKQISHRQTHLE